MAQMKHRNSKQVIDVADHMVRVYAAQGWKVVDGQEPTPDPGGDPDPDPDALGGGLDHHIDPLDAD